MAIAKKDIKFVAREFLDALFNCTGKKYTPFGKFVCRDEVNGKVVWVAVDNTHGDAFTEEFAKRKLAVMWLNGYPVTNIQGDPLNEMERWLYDGNAML